MTSKVLAEPILVGREHELEELHSFLNSTVNGKGTIVFVSGEAGAGKTRLITEFLNQAKKQKVTILTGWCLSNAAVPYFPFFEAFNRYFSAEPEQKEVEIKTWLMGPSETGEFGRTQMITPQVWKDQTFTAVANTLASISAKQPVIMFIDDLHWADSASLALMHYLAKTVNSEKVLVLATFRSEQLAADVEGRPHPLVETLRLMRREDTIKEITVKSLDQTGVSTLAKNMLGGELQQDLAQKLAEESQGNPLFIVESLRMLNEGNGLIQEQNQWRLTSDAIGIPPKIKDIILQRLSALGRNQKNVLEMASVLGEKFDAGLLAFVLGQDQIDVIKILDAISKDTSLVRCEGELYRFDHGRTRDAIYDDISPALKRVYHGKVAERLENNSINGNVPLSDLAYHYTQAANKDKALKYSLAAGQDALAKWSNAEAIKQFNFVVQMVEQTPQYSQEKTVALEGLGDAYAAGDNFKQAVTIYEQLAQIQTGAAKLRALRKGLKASFYEGDISKQRSFTKQAEQIANTDRLETGRLFYTKAFVFESPSDWLTSKEFDEKALMIFEEENSLEDAAHIQVWLGFGQCIVGLLETGIANALRAIAMYNELGDFRSQLEAYAYAGGSFQACSLIEDSNRMFAKAVEVNEHYKIWDYVRMFPAYVWEAMGLMSENPAASISKALKALEYFEKTDSRLYAGAVYGILIVAHALADDIAHVDEYYAKLMSLPKYILQNAPSQIYMAPVMLTYYASKKEYEKCDKIFNDWLTVIRTFFPSPFMEASSRQLYAWALGKQNRMREAQAELQEAQRILEAARQRFSHVNILPSILTLTRPKVNQPFQVRLYLVNVSTVPGTILKVDGFPKELEIIDASPNCNVNYDGNIEFEDTAIARFEVKTVKLTVKAKTAENSTFILSPQVTYLNDLGEPKNCSSRPLTITVQPILEAPKIAAPTAAPIQQTIKPFNVFLCYKKSSAKDFADHLKVGLEELGLRTFLDSKDIPMMVDGQVEWAKIRDQALQESKIFILIMTPGFELSSELVKELNMARKQGGKEFVYFRHRNMGRKIVVQLENEALDIGKQEQVSFETKEELLRLAHNILFKERMPNEPSKDTIKSGSDSEIDILKKFSVSHSTKK